MIEKEDGWKIFQRVKAEKEARVKAAKENEAKEKEAVLVNVHQQERKLRQGRKE